METFASSSSSTCLAFTLANWKYSLEIMAMASMINRGGPWWDHREDSGDNRERL